MGDAYARRTDPGTALDAAESVVEQLPALEAAVLAAVAKRGDDGLTSHELAQVTALSLVTVSPRLRPLANKGLIVDSGERRKGESGRPSIVWKLAPRSTPQQLTEQAALL